MRIRSIRTWIIIVLSAIIIITIVAPNKKVEVVQKEEAGNIHATSTQTTASTSIDPNIHFLIEDEVVTINTENIPILYSLLSTSQNIHLTKNKMSLQKVEPLDTYLLSFNCQKSCSYMIINMTKDMESMLLADYVKFKKYYVSPNRDKVLFVFHQKGYDKTIVFDLNEWKQIKYTTLQEVTDPLNIQDIQWLDNKSYELSLSTTTQTVIYEEMKEE